jgi:DNA-binding CsgD family transcriptional regulator
VLSDRRAECEQLDRLLDAARMGESSVLVLRGEAGIGKSALLAHVAERAADCRILRAAGAESEMELAFASLHQLCGPLLDEIERLPPPQRAALGTAFGLDAGTPPDRFLVGLAVLTLLSDAGHERPVVCLVDDAQWLDGVSAQVLAFVARRLQAEAIVLVFATRNEPANAELAGLPHRVVEGLADADAREVLTSAIAGRLDERVVERIVAESQGNPLALLELPHPSAQGALAGGFGVPQTLPGRIEESFRQRVVRLPPDTRRLLLIAAAEPVGDPALLWRASATLGIDIDAAAPAEQDGLLGLGAQVRFRHPLVRSAVYGAASTDERRKAHGALAEATDSEVDPDRLAWHRAHAAVEPDEEVASELERSADRAQARGGLAAAAAFLERAARLTPDPARRAERALSAAQAKQEAGDPDASLELLAVAAAGPLDELPRARMEQLRARLAFVKRRGSDAPLLLLQAARHLEPHDPTLALEAYLEALGAAHSIGRRDTVREVAAALQAAPRSVPPGPVELLLIAHALLVSDGYSAGTPALRNALDAFRQARLPAKEEMRGLPFACISAVSLWDDESWLELSARYVQLARDSGALSVLPEALEIHGAIQVHAGEFVTAEAMLVEAATLATATGSAPVRDAMLLLVAWSEESEQALARIEGVVDDAMSTGEETAITYAEYAAAVLHNSLGQYELAAVAAQRSNAHHPRESGGAAQIELIEAAVRSNAPAVAETAFRHLSARTRAAGTDWALGIEARSAALLANAERAEVLYREAIERLGRTQARTDLARAHLLYGEWLRRERRRLDAREQLRTAHELFSTIGAPAFAKRAARELLATGERARARTSDTRGDLTAQESQIAQLACDGLSNPEIGARLFISPRTVEYHMHKVFTKLAISSRGELPRVLGDEPTRRPLTGALEGHGGTRNLE